MSFLNELISYPGKWVEKSVQSLSEEEKAILDVVEVVEGNFGLSAKFVLTNGVYKYCPLSKDCTAQLGDFLDVNNIRIITLTRADETIQRVDIVTNTLFDKFSSDPNCGGEELE